MTSLTIPQPLVPVVVSTGRLNASLQWDSLYVPDVGDKTRFGFNVSVCTVYTGDSPQGDILDRNADFKNCRVLVLERKELKDLGHYYVSGDVMVSRFGVDVFELEPKNSYAFRVKLLYGDAGSSAPSDRSAVCVTKPIEPPEPPAKLIATAEEGRSNAIRLEFTKPIDNGGKAIVGYHVFVRHTENNRYFPEVIFLIIFCLIRVRSNFLLVMDLEWDV